MKLLIISDVHSNIANLEAVLSEESDADEIYCAGDLVDVGFDPRALSRPASDRVWINPGSIGYNRPADPFPPPRTPGVAITAGAEAGL